MIEKLFMKFFEALHSDFKKFWTEVLFVILGLGTKGSKLTIGMPAPSFYLQY